MIDSIQLHFMKDLILQCRNIRDWIWYCKFVVNYPDLPHHRTFRNSNGDLLGKVCIRQFVLFIFKLPVIHFIHTNLSTAVSRVHWNEWSHVSRGWWRMWSDWLSSRAPEPAPEDHEVQHTLLLLTLLALSFSCLIHSLSVKLAGRCKPLAVMMVLHHYLHYQHQFGAWS